MLEFKVQRSTQHVSVVLFFVCPHCFWFFFLLSILVSFPPAHWPFIDGASYTLLDVRPEGRVAGTGTFLWNSVGLGHAVKTIVPSVYIIPDMYTLASSETQISFIFISKSRLPGQLSENQLHAPSPWQLLSNQIRSHHDSRDYHSYCPDVRSPFNELHSHTYDVQYKPNRHPEPNLKSPAGLVAL